MLVRGSHDAKERKEMENHISTDTVLSWEEMRVSTFDVLSNSPINVFLYRHNRITNT